MIPFVTLGVVAGRGNTVYDHPNFVEYAEDTDETLPALRDSS